ncbi:isoaspartyl dipeptidase IadA [Gottschalkia acidurici 9a]|uniref:Isoaspartyl dipeptidase n=1 Tax=Gottschalkia acidurici (strain ATCC 7906 / DSM 604 / BCRC 14475 / CIP 104303 / KCTC 5404 / NCIMB 10678 / 9a) TaxID=1128398 RepID=K0AXE2_GOTA9|nr:beta-aspartyl-peptidase [Gottschalkia acidurici]AFS77864.1 isoaspartyl dipeptidase IadA [Gottschalkia acidurici 9a]
MFILLKSGECYTPESIGKKDILIAFDKIYKIEDEISKEKLWDTNIIDCTDKIIIPGLIDQHVHITGGGGEEGPVSRIPEIQLSEIVSAGVTTLVGVLGFDSITRNISNLLAKANALQTEGITSYIYTGSYSIPTSTLTGNVVSDISLVDKVIGVGEVALADYRSSHPNLQMLKELASEAMTGGLIGSKAGIVHIHVGDGKEGLKLLFRLIEESDFPIDMFIPTHINRNKKLFEQSLEFLDMGGFIDITAGESSEKGYSLPDAIEKLIKDNKNLDNVTASSDGNGSNGGNGICKMSQLFDDMRDCIIEKKIDITSVLKVSTTNVAKFLKIYPQKGTIKDGSDADILILDKETLNIDTVIIGGKIFMKNGEIIRKGKFESNIN